MVDVMNWFLTFFAKCINLLFSIVSIDGYSFGYMVLAACIVGVIVAGTIGVVGIVSNSIRRYSEAERRDRA